MSADVLNYVKIEDELELHGVCAINTVGVSMHPLLKTNDAVTVKKVDRKIKKYDVVLYKAPSIGKYILHRVIGVRSDMFIIRGDNTYQKEYVPKEAVIGYMISYIRNGKVKDTKSFGYRIYSRFHTSIYPLRVLMRKIKSVMRKILKKG